MRCEVELIVAAEVRDAPLPMANDSKKRLNEKNMKTMATLKKGLLIYWVCYAALRAALYKYVHTSQLVFTGLTFFVA